MAFLLGLPVIAGCTLLARDHACYPFVAHRLEGHIPKPVLQTLARERGTTRSVGRYRAPLGYYLRPRTNPPPLVRGKNDLARYELLPCPRVTPPDTPPTSDPQLPPVP